MTEIPELDTTQIIQIFLPSGLNPNQTTEVAKVVLDMLRKWDHPYSVITLETRHIPAGCTGRSAQQGRARDFIACLKANGIKDFTIFQAEQFFRKTGWRSHWNLNYSACDGHGFKRSLGDTFGGHGLHLESRVDYGAKYKNYVVP